MLEWTKLETGVGAAIAWGNQDLKGVCLLLVIAVSKNKNLKEEHPTVNEFLNLPIRNDEKNHIKVESPKRLVKTVTIPLLEESHLLKYTTKRYLVSPNPSQPSINLRGLEETNKTNIDKTNKNFKVQYFTRKGYPTM